MEMSFSHTFWKYTLLGFIITISLVDVVFISIGVVSLGAVGSVMGAYIVTSLGAIIFTISFVGCFAALRESYVLSFVFLGLSIVTIVLQMVFIIALAVYNDDLLEMSAERIDGLWDAETEKSGAMDNIHVMFGCCGKESPQDFLQDDDDVLPKSCCQLFDCTSAGNIYSKGCVGTVAEYFDDQNDYLVLIIIGLTALELMGIVSAFYLARSLPASSQKSEQIIIHE
ncbi:tetraspanin-9 [Teleopsis dalmanni]|uniref:tetraspanin-9 n=1 Tax=Teleopsis dalmanni TaxID=139649 RepID=UPI0018CDF171|nr:tetraspanin-9 [Teleopsis dalmanni]